MEGEDSEWALTRAPMARTVDQAWIVCHGQTLLVIRRAVACPLRGHVPARICRSCRYLVTSSDDRLRDRSCVVEEPLSSATANYP